MPEFASGCVRASLGKGHLASQQSVAGGAKGRRWFQKAASTGQDKAARRMIVVPAALFGIASQRCRYDEIPFVRPHGTTCPSVVSQPVTREAGVWFFARSLRVADLADERLALEARDSYW